MKRLFTYLFLPALGLLLAGCSEASQAFDDTAATGTCSMKVSTRAESASDGYDPTEHLVVRIYNDKEELIRKYTSKADLPERLELIAGSYRVAVEAGEKQAASFTARYYTGAEPFTVSAGVNTPVEVSCTLQNTAVATLFEESVGTNLGTSFEVRVMPGSTYDESLADEPTTLRYTENTTGYFLLDEGVDALSWHFSGTHVTSGKKVEQSGTISEVKAPGKYTLTFRYSPDLPGYIEAVVIRVDDSTDDFDDTIIWSPDPTIEGDGFDLSEPQQYTGGEKRFQLATVKPMVSAMLTFAGQPYNLLAAVSTPVAGIKAEKTAENALTVTLSDDFFAGCPGGDQPLLFEVTDNGGGTGRAECIFSIQGIQIPTATDYDLWANTVKLRARVFDPSASTVTFGLRTKNGEWQETAGSNNGDGTWSASFSVEWEESTNENGQTVYTPKTGSGIWANGEYECRVVIDGQESLASFTTAGGQSIPGGDMEDGSMSCFTTNNQNTAFWGSGNNGNTSTLCTQGNLDGNHYANMQSTYYIAAMAAGNLFTGTFSMSGFTGTVSFGQPYTYTARPRALKIDYHALVGTVNNNKGNGPLAINSQDRARIYVAIVEWESRHIVSSTFSLTGSCSNSGTWDPTAGSNAVSEGRILGYGSMWIDQSTEGEAMVSSGDGLKIFWYDKNAAAPNSNYTLVISCAANAYGDYFNGCDTNHLWVDNFQWVY